MTALRVRPGVSVRDRFLANVVARCRKQRNYSVKLEIANAIAASRLFECYWATRTAKDRSVFIADVNAHVKAR